jgi:hypothetical protein
VLLLGISPEIPVDEDTVDCREIRIRSSGVRRGGNIAYIDPEFFKTFCNPLDGPPVRGVRMHAVINYSNHEFFFKVHGFLRFFLQNGRERCSWTGRGSFTYPDGYFPGSLNWMYKRKYPASHGL